MEARLARLHLRSLAGQPAGGRIVALVRGGERLLVLLVGRRRALESGHRGLVSILAEVPARSAHLRHRAPVRVHTFLRGWMAREQARHPVLLRASRVLANEQFLQRDGGLQVVARELHVLHAVVVRLELVVAAVLGLQHLCAHRRALAHHLAELRAPVHGRTDARDGRADLYELALLHLLRTVPCGRVHDLVAEHRRELGLVLQLDEQAAVDGDLAAWQRPGVELAAVEHHEFVGQRAVGHGSEPVADLPHVLGDARVGDVIAAL